jgi:hypothetical protein
MKVNEELIMLTAEDIRHARNVDLAALTGMDATAFAAWSANREISGRNLNAIATALGMPKHEVLKGIELRKADTAIARAVQEKLERLLASRTTATVA